jgi:2-phospho-L-lactate guanylyltransferase
VPLKPFTSAKGRLAEALDPPTRATLMRATASRVVRAAAATGALVVVVTGDPEVAAWARRIGAEVLAEPPRGGLDGAARAAAEGALAADAVWCIVHGDLPLLEPRHVAAALEAADAGATVLGPSRTGGTNLIASRMPLGFSYGPSSFRRHLAAAGPAEARILCETGTLLDLDTPDDLAVAAALPGGSWLAGFLT